MLRKSVILSTVPSSRAGENALSAAAETPALRARGDMRAQRFPIERESGFCKARGSFPPNPRAAASPKGRTTGPHRFAFRKAKLRKGNVDRPHAVRGAGNDGRPAQRAQACFPEERERYMIVFPARPARADLLPQPLCRRRKFSCQIAGSSAAIKKPACFCICCPSSGIIP